MGAKQSCYMTHPRYGTIPVDTPPPPLDSRWRILKEERKKENPKQIWERKAVGIKKREEAQLQCRRAKHAVLEKKGYFNDFYKIQEVSNIETKPKNMNNDFITHYYDPRRYTEEQRHNLTFVGRCNDKQKQHPRLNGKFATPFTTNKSIHPAYRSYAFERMINRMLDEEKKCMCKQTPIPSVCN